MAGNVISRVLTFYQKTLDLIAQAALFIFERQASVFLKVFVFLSYNQGQKSLGHLSDN